MSESDENMLISPLGTPLKVKSESVKIEPKIQGQDLFSGPPKLEDPSRKLTFGSYPLQATKTEEKDITEYLTTIENLSNKVAQQNLEREDDAKRFNNMLDERDSQLRELNNERGQLLSERAGLEEYTRQQTSKLQQHIDSQSAHTHETLQTASQLEQELSSVMHDKSILERQNFELVEKMKHASQLEQEHIKLREFSSEQEKNLREVNFRLEQADSQLNRARHLEKN